jgi:Domain of unknown function (DUF4148)
MKAKHLIAAVAVFAATGSVFAQQTEFVAPDAKFVSTKSRAQVAAELKQVRANGEVQAKEYVDTNALMAGEPRSRDEVRAEVAKSTQAHRQAGVNDLYFGA